MTSTILKLLSSALSIWDHKEKNKYIDSYLTLSKNYHKALRAQPLDNGLVDQYERDIERLANVLSHEISGAPLKD